MRHHSTQPCNETQLTQVNLTLVFPNTCNVALSIDFYRPVRDDPAMKTAVSGLESMDDGLNKQRATVTHCKVMIK